MAQTINSNGQIVTVNNNLRQLFTLNQAITTTGSNSLANNANVTTGSWQVVDQGSNADFRYGYFANLDLTSSIKVAITTGGTTSFAVNLQPSDVAILCSSGSTVIYAQASGSNGQLNGSAILQYFVTEQ
jgi:hypothetical protein